MSGEELPACIGNIRIHKKRIYVPESFLEDAADLGWFTAPDCDSGSGESGSGGSGECCGTFVTINNDVDIFNGAILKFIDTPASVCGFGVRWAVSAVDPFVIVQAFVDVGDFENQILSASPLITVGQVNPCGAEIDLVAGPQYSVIWSDGVVEQWDTTPVVVTITGRTEVIAGVPEDVTGKVTLARSDHAFTTSLRRSITAGEDYVIELPPSAEHADSVTDAKQDVAKFSFLRVVDLNFGADVWVNTIWDNLRAYVSAVDVSEVDPLGNEFSSFVSPCALGVPADNVGVKIADIGLGGFVEGFADMHYLYNNFDISTHKDKNGDEVPVLRTHGLSVAITSTYLYVNESGCLQAKTVNAQHFNGLLCDIEEEPSDEVNNLLPCEDGSGSPGSGCTQIPFLPFDNIPTGKNPTFVLGFDANGCLIKVPTTVCPTGSGTESVMGTKSESSPTAETKDIPAIDSTPVPLTEADWSEIHKYTMPKKP